MSLALAAELNGFPGPAHVVELGEKLRLTKDQEREATALTEQMKADAQRFGKDAIETLSAPGYCCVSFEKEVVDWCCD